MEFKHGGCFVCGSKDQEILQSRTIYKLTTQKGELSHVPRSIALCQGCENVTTVDLRETAGK